MRTFIWKQASEAKRPTLALVAILAVTVLYVITYELTHRFRDPVASFYTMAMLFSLIAPIWLGVQVAHGELKEGSLRFTAALPISLQRVAAIRLATAAAALVLPLILAALPLALLLTVGVIKQVPINDPTHSVESAQRIALPALGALHLLAALTAIAVWNSVQLLLFISLGATHLRRPSQAGFLGAVLSFVCFLSSAVFWGKNAGDLARTLWGSVFPLAQVTVFGYGSEKGSYSELDLNPHFWTPLLLSIPGQLILVWVFLRQYAEMENRIPGTDRGWSRFLLTSWSRWLPSPGRSQYRALQWLELRQALPLVGFGLLFTALVAALNAQEAPTLDFDFTTLFLMNLPGGSWFVGGLWATVVGSGIFSAELESRLGTFWRTRPIPVTRWFWMKYSVGLLAVLGVLDGLVILLSWNAPRTSMTTGMSWAYVACFPILHAFLYSLAVLGTCWRRQPLVGALGAILGYAALMLTFGLVPAWNFQEPISIYNSILNAERGGNFSLNDRTYLLTYGCLFVATFALPFWAEKLASPLLRPRRASAN